MDDPTRMGGTMRPTPAPRRPKSNLDSPSAKKILEKLQGWFQSETDRQAANRYQMALDCGYYDNLQWSEEDAAVLIERGQAPCVYNEIKPSIDWMLGTERRTRIDYKVLPRRKDEGDLAETKTKLMKYLSDVNASPLARSRAFAQAIKAGVGWIEVGIKGDESDEPVYYRSEDWRYMLYDSQSVEPDLSDARYIYRWKWVDLDVAEAMFPQRKAVIRQSAVDAANKSQEDDDDPAYYLGARVTEPGADYARIGKYRPYDGGALAPSKRDRVKLIEAWYREPTRQQVLRGGPRPGEAYDESNSAHQAALEDGASVHDALVMQVRMAIYTEAGLLFEGPSPYTHGRFPFVPVWAYRRSLDNAPYSPIRVMRDSQDSLNKRGSKALWILSTNQIVMEEGAVDDIEALRDEAARPDAIIVRARGKELLVNRDGQLAEQHLRLMDRDAVAIRNGGGVTAENLGRETNANSGKAILARQDQGGVVTSELFDNLRWAVQWAGELELSLVEQFFTSEKTVRLVGERGTASFVEVNARDPNTGQILNDITATKADFVVSQQDYRDSLRIAMFESLMEIVGRIAQMDQHGAGHAGPGRRNGGHPQPRRAGVPHPRAERPTRSRGRGHPRGAGPAATAGSGPAGPAADDDGGPAGGAGPAQGRGRQARLRRRKGPGREHQQAARGHVQRPAVRPDRRPGPRGGGDGRRDHEGRRLRLQPHRRRAGHGGPGGRPAARTACPGPTPRGSARDAGRARSGRA